MIPPLFRTPSRTIAALYGAIVAQARDPRFYQAYGVPDTVLGRFDLIVLHLSLVLRRLREGDHAARIVAQGVFDEFCGVSLRFCKTNCLANSSCSRRSEWSSQKTRGNFPSK